MTSSGEKQDKTLAALVFATACPIAPGDVMGGRYTVELLLGEGTFAWVFSAIDSAAAQPLRVAVKVLRPERAQIPETLRRFQERELALLRRVARAGPVRNVVQVLEPLLGMHRSLPFIVLEFIDGPSLRDRINDGRPFTEVEAARIGHGIARGLAALHASGIVHRDLKPANIQLRGGTEPVIVDLGIATAPDVTAGFTATGKEPMTPRYAAPEQLAGRSADAPCDVYAFGVILEEMAAGMRLDAIALRCLERDPLRRPSAPWVVDAIGSLLRADPGERRWASILRAMRFFALGAVSLGTSGQAFSTVEVPRWTPVTPMHVCRGEHTATRLANGDVLIVGGYDMKTRAFVTTAERYDQTQERWTLAGTIPPRKMHTATLLPSEEVLVAGGVGPDGSLADAMRYIPDSNTWTKATPMGAARARFTSTWLPVTNQVLVVGGTDARGVPQVGVERYDPKSDHWTTAAPLRIARAAHVALWIPLLERVLVLGGSVERGLSLTGLELYDPTANGWTAGAPMPIGRDYFTATLLADGRVLTTGGMRGGTTLASAEIYDPRADRWMDAASMHSARHKHVATLLDDGRVLVTGGASSVDAEIYDPTLNLWSLGGPPVKRLKDHITARGTDRRGLITGRRGADACACNLLNSGAHEPRPTSRWTPAPPVYAARNNHTMTLLPDGRVLMIGVPYSIFAMTASPPDRFAPTGTLLLDDTEELIAESGHADGKHSTTERYDSVRTVVPPMYAARNNHTMTLLPDGRVLMVGVPYSTFVNLAETCDLPANAWEQPTPMTASSPDSFAPLGGKRLTGSSEIYTPATDTWTQEMPSTAPWFRAT